MTTPTPALRSAIHNALAPFARFQGIAGNRMKGGESMDDVQDAILSAITPFLAPAPVEQARREACPECGGTKPWCELQDRIRNYLGNGGLFNPEFMEHQKVRDLLMDINAALTAHFQSLATEKGREDMAKWAAFGERILRGAKEASASGMMSEEDEATLECAMQCGVGNVQRVLYDPAIHGNDMEDAEPGDYIWWWGAARASTGKGDGK